MRKNSTIAEKIPSSPASHFTTICPCHHSKHVATILSPCYYKETTFTLIHYVILFDSHFAVDCVVWACKMAFSLILAISCKPIFLNLVLKIGYDPM